MSRPIKDGMEYFSHDCDASYDEKIESLCAIYGHHVAYSIVFRLYERIYRSGGKLVVSEPETMQILSRNVAKMSVNKFKKILESCMKLKIFDKVLYEEAKIITSKGILNRIEPIISKRMKMRELYENNNLSKIVSAAETPVSGIVSAAETPPETPPETRQSKVKERKEKQTKQIKYKNIHSNIAKDPGDHQKRVAKFEEAWEEYPRKLGKPQALRCFMTQIRTAEDWTLLLQGIENYIADIAKNQTQEKFIKHGSSFFNNCWREWGERKADG